MKKNLLCVVLGVSGIVLYFAIGSVHAGPSISPLLGAVKFCGLVVALICLGFIADAFAGDKVANLIGDPRHPIHDLHKDPFRRTFDREVD